MCCEHMDKQYPQSKYKTCSHTQTYLRNSVEVRTSALGVKPRGLSTENTNKLFNKSIAIWKVNYNFL